MSNAYPEMLPKPEKNKVVCLLCEHLDPYDSEIDSYCVEKKKSIQPDQVGEERVCREYDPKKVKKKKRAEDPQEEPQ